ncbi:MAG: pitrilysin family protein [Longimicrobiales bacterium]|nr:pitrilysin family protein [Longimicrobiales bacterium]
MTRALVLSLALGAALLLGRPALAGAQDRTPGEQLPVREHTLANGMRLLVLPRPGAPTVSFVVRYEVGGVHEHLGTTGIAHLLEHLLFKGTRSIGTHNAAGEEVLFLRMDAAHDTLVHARARGDSTEVRRLATAIAELEDSARVFVEPNELDRIFTKAGARGLNATTTNEATTYYVELPSNRAELWFVLEGDRMANPVFREFYTERDVVMEERRMRVETNPGGLLYEVHMGTAFQVHPYGVPVVGTMSDLESLSRRDVADYFRRFYAPNNAVVGIVGNVDPDRVLAWAEKYLAWVPGGEEPTPVIAREPAQRGERRVEVVWDAEPALRIGWHVPDWFDDDAPALSVLTSLLTGGRTARLHRRLVLDDRSVSGVTSSMGPGERFPQLFQIDATPQSPHTPSEVEAAIYEELARLAAEGPSLDELERVRNQIAAGNVRRLQSNLGLAFQLVESASLSGDWRETFRLPERLRAVTPDDIRRVVARYFTSENRTVGTLVRARVAP